MFLINTEGSCTHQHKMTKAMLNIEAALLFKDLCCKGLHCEPFYGPIKIQVSEIYYISDRLQNFICT